VFQGFFVTVLPRDEGDAVRYIVVAETPADALLLLRADVPEARTARVGGMLPAPKETVRRLGLKKGEVRRL
jgi:hypothetical protein